MRMVRNLIVDEQAQDLLEYGLLIGIITAGCILAVTGIATKVQAYFVTLNANLP